MAARAASSALPGLEVEWAIVRRGMRRAAALVVDEAAAADTAESMRRNARLGLIGVARAAAPVRGRSDAILARAADRADPAAALAAALADARAAMARARRARRRIAEAKRKPRPPRSRRKTQPPPS